MSQLGELARWQERLGEAADVYVVNPDGPDAAAQLRSITGLRLPLLRDSEYRVAVRFGLVGPGRPMGGRVGYVVIDAKGIVRAAAVDIDFGAHAPEILQIVRQTGR